MHAARLAALSVALLLAPLSALSTAAAADADDLKVTVSAPASARVGAGYSASIYVSNADASDALGGVTVTILATPLLHGSAVSGATCTQGANGAWSCAIGALAATQRAALTLTGTVAPLAAGLAGTGAQAVRASATSTEVAGPVVATGATAVVGRADVSATLSLDDADILFAGSTPGRAIVSNAGPSAAAVTASIVAPPGAVLEIRLGACGGSQPYGIDGTRVACDLGTLEPGASTMIPLTLHATQSGSLSVVAYPANSVAGASRVYFSTLDSALGNNAAAVGFSVAKPTEEAVEDIDDGLFDEEDEEEEEETLLAPAALGATFSGPTASLPRGTTGTWSYRVSNTGGSPSEALRATFAISSGTGRLSGALPSAGSCATAAALVSCELGAIAPGGSATVTLSAIGDAVGTLAIAPSQNAGTAPGAASATISAASADLAFTRFDTSTTTARVGETVTVTIEVKNNGPSSVRDAYVQTSIPAGLVIDVDQFGPCVKMGSNIRCMLGSIGAGAAKSVDISLSADAPGSYTADGTAASSAADGVSVNNQKSLTVHVRAL